MPDNLNIRQPEDTKRININQPWEVDYWSKKFQCSEDDLKNAVNQFGTNAEKIKNYFE